MKTLKQFSLKKIFIPILQLVLLLLLLFIVVVVRAFPPILTTNNSRETRNIYNRRRQHQEQRGGLFQQQEYQSQRRKRQRQRQLHLSNSNDNTPPQLPPLSDNDGSYDYDEFTPAEVIEMKDLIVSLSDISNDASRRNRLQKVCDEALQGSNGTGTPRRFSVLFDRVLTQVGEQVQQEARKKFSERADDDNNNRALNRKEIEDNADADADADGMARKTTKKKGKTSEELKLWALVDMMVQSKTVFKKQSS